MPYPNGAKCAHADAEEGETRCKPCKAVRRKQEAERRAERKRKRQCWVCAAKCAPGLTSCEAHRGLAWRS